MQTFTDHDIELLLDPVRLITLITEAFRDRYPTILQPQRLQIKLPHGILLIMPCADPGGRTLGTKFILVPSEPGAPLQSTYLLMDGATAQPHLLIPANTVTDLRTAAASAAATRALARMDVHVLGVFGTGHQARAHLRVLPIARHFERILVCGSNPKRTTAFAKEMSEALKTKVEPASPQSVASESDVLCTCTTATEPLFDGTWLKPGAHLNVVGAFQPHTREVDDATIIRSRVYVDTYEGCLAEAGDLLIPLMRGAIAREHIRGDLHDLFSGKRPGRESPLDITLFKSVGCALEDLVTAELIASAVAT
jgi:ornithine cyclodeaminase/alanine dehydrogenase-like protein (mu-crystallin family)